MINLQNAEFLRSAAGLEGLPKDALPQVVFAGRSNVGKSSVINCLLSRKNLAHTSSTPGRTANINLYLIDKQLYLADLPGYGFAKVSPEERRRWGELMDSYFRSSSNIKLGVLVTDHRREPTEDDVAMAKVFRDIGVPFVVAANKADKCPKSQIAELNEKTREILKPSAGVVSFSAFKGLGKQELLNSIFQKL